MITHLCTSCAASVEVARADITELGSGPQFIWGRWEQCPGCGSRAAPMEVVDANDRRLGLGQWGDRS